MTYHPDSSWLVVFTLSNIGMVDTMDDTTIPKTWEKVVIEYIKKSKKKVMRKWEIIHGFLIIWWPFFMEYKTFTYDGYNELFHKSWNDWEVSELMARTEVDLVRTFDSRKLTKTLTYFFEWKKDLSPYNFSTPKKRGNSQRANAERQWPLVDG